MTPPNSKHYAFRQQLRHFAAQGPSVTVNSAELISLLDILDEQDEALYTAWEISMGEDL
jgi:hypothetical protein